MSEALNPIITEQGLQAVFNASSDGFAAVITHIALGNHSYAVPVNSDGRATQIALRNEQQRVEIADGRRAAPHQIDLSFVAEGPAEYWVRELGFHLGDGTLFAVWSDANRALAWKSASVPLIVGLELVLATLPAESVTVQPGAAPLQLIMTRELAAIGTALANLQLEQLRQADQRIVDRQEAALARLQLERLHVADQRAVTRQLTAGLAAVGAALANLQLEQLRQAERLEAFERE